MVPRVILDGIRAVEIMDVGRTRTFFSVHRGEARNRYLFWCTGKAECGLVWVAQI